MVILLFGIGICCLIAVLLINKISDEYKCPYRYPNLLFIFGILVGWFVTGMVFDKCDEYYRKNIHEAIEASRLDTPSLIIHRKYIGDSIVGCDSIVEFKN